MIVARVVLGVFEAGFGPGIPLYMCMSPCPQFTPIVLTRDALQAFWYTRYEMGVRMAYWFGFAAVAGAFGGLIAFGVQNAHTAIANWRLLFLVEGIPAVAMGFIAMVFLPNRPEETPFLNEDERKIQMERQSRGLKADVGRTINPGEF